MEIMNKHHIIKYNHNLFWVGHYITSNQ